MRNFKVGDLVEFVPHYVSSGMQGGTLKMQLPIYDCLGLVIKVYDKQLVIMIPTAEKISVGKATAQIVASLN